MYLTNIQDVNNRDICIINTKQLWIQFLSQKQVIWVKYNTEPRLKFSQLVFHNQLLQGSVEDLLLAQCQILLYISTVSNIFYWVILDFYFYLYFYFIFSFILTFLHSAWLSRGGSYLSGGESPPQPGRKCQNNSIITKGKMQRARQKDRFNQIGEHV